MSTLPDQAAIGAAEISILHLASLFEKQAQIDEGFAFGRVSIGAENIEYRWKADALRLLLRRVKNGSTIEKAVNDTKSDAKSWIRRHNARCPKDINWQRWDGVVDSDIERSASLIAPGFNR